MDQETLGNIKEKIAEVHGQLENVLYNSSLKVGEDISPEQLVEINNLVQRLDKNTLDLGAALTENSNNETAGETI